MFLLKSNPGDFLLAEPEFEVFRHEPDDPFSLSNSNLYRVCDFNNNYLLIASVDGLNLLNKSTKKVNHFFYDELDPESINSNIIRFVYRDRDNNIWVATNKGVGKYQKKNFQTFKHSSYKGSISHDKVQDVLETEDGKILLATVKGIDSYDREKRKFQSEIQIKNDGSGLLASPLVIVNDSSNGIWIGTWAGGISYYNIKNHKLVNYLKEPILNDFSYVVELFIDSRQNLWIGTAMSGLRRFNLKTKKYDVFTHSKDDTTSINSNRILNILEDSNHAIWIGTGAGLSRFVPEGNGYFKRYLGEVEISIIFETHSGDFLFGSHDGLFKFDRKNGGYNIFGESKKFISGILEDADHNLWISEDKVLSKYTINNGSVVDVSSFRDDEGLQVGNFCPRACIVLKDKSMIFCGSSGFSLFNPVDVKKDTLPPTIVFEEIKIRGTTVGANQEINNQVILEKSLPETKNIVLNHWNNAFSIVFTGIQYNLPQYNQYAYRLDGYEETDSSWHFTDAQNREVKYMNLPAGEYFFKVKAANSYGIWNARVAGLHIEILPPWWKTLWFRILALFCISVIIIGFYRYRLRTLKRQKKVLEQKVFERTSELREANSQLEEKQEEILQQNEELITKNDEIQKQKKEIELSKQKIEKAFNNIIILSEFGQKITATFDFEGINSMIYKYVSSLMDTAAFGIGLYNEKRKIIDFPYFMENGKPIPYFYKDLSNKKSLSVKCFKNSEEILINDLSQEYINYLEKLPETQSLHLPSSVIHLPLLIENRPIGTITVNSYKKNAFKDGDVANLRTLASYISIALDNSKAYRIIRSKNEQINGSIRYGQTIQQAMLPPKKQIDKYFENFILFRPKDIVSGDFYWFASVNNPLNPQGLDSDNTQNPQGFNNGYYFLAVVDCTGHGVPGAFMSMIGSRLLNDIVIERKIHSPSKILEELDIMVRKALRQDTTDNHDGMDLCLCRFHQKLDGWELSYAGAKRPLILYNSISSKIEEIQGSRRSIGGIISRNVKVQFTESIRIINTEDVFYLSTDGLVDQCNPQKRKFSHKKLLDILKKISTQPLKDQKNIVEKELDAFQDGFEQRDDITLVGVKIKSTISE